MSSFQSALGKGQYTDVGGSRHSIIVERPPDTHELAPVVFVADLNAGGPSASVVAPIFARDISEIIGRVSVVSLPSEFPARQQAGGPSF